MPTQVPSSTQRVSPWPLFAGIVLLLLFAGLVVHQLQAKRIRLAPNVELVKTLLNVEFVEEKPPTGLHALDWPQWRGLRRDGVGWMAHLLTKWPDRGPLEVWKIPGGEGYSSMAVTGGRVYTMLHEEDKKTESILCVHALTGKEIWRMSYERSPLTVAYGNFPRSTPTVDGGQVFSLGPTGRLQCRGAEGGELVWEHDLLKEYQGRLPQWGYSCSPLVLGERVFVNPGGSEGNSIVAFGRKTGKELWKALDDPAGYSSPISVTVGGIEQVVFFTGHSLVGLSAEEGNLLWRYPWPTPFEVNAATPLAFQTKSDGQVHQFFFITSGYRTGCALLRLDGNKDAGFQYQEIFTSNELASHFSTPVRYKDHVYGFNEDVLTCLSLRTGEARWKMRGYNKGTLMLIQNPEKPESGAHLLVLGEAGKLALLEATPDGGENGPTPVAEVQSPLRRRCWPMPVLAGGRLYLRDETQIICLKLSGE
jgi:outer membrane protein assembly factor BamB